MEYKMNTYLYTICVVCNHCFDFESFGFEYIFEWRERSEHARRKRRRGRKTLGANDGR